MNYYGTIVKAVFAAAVVLASDFVELLAKARR